jgi:hypothetical protein
MPKAETFSRESKDDVRYFKAAERIPFFPLSILIYLLYFGTIDSFLIRAILKLKGGQ